MMDHQQTQQTEQIIAEMLEFLETSSEDEYDADLPQPKDGPGNSIKKDLTDNVVANSTKNNKKTKNELKKLRHLVLCNSKEIVSKISQDTNNSTDINSAPETKCCPSKSDNLDWQFKLESHCRCSFNNTYTQEVYKAIYQNTNGHPCSGSGDYHQAAQNYALYGKEFLDFPKNMPMLLADMTTTGQSPVPESSNFGSCLYSKSNLATPNTTIPGNGIPSVAASTAAYYQLLNNMQAQTRSALAASPVSSTAYGIFMGNKVTYVAGTPTTPSLIYNQHNTTTTNFISNSLANAALATSPTILYTNPLLATTTQQYLTQFLSAAAITSNSLQSTTVSANAGCGSVYERLIYAQMLQQQLYQTQQAASISAKFQNKQRAANPSARQAATVINASSNRSSPQHSAAAAPLPVSLNACYRQARSTSPGELAGLKLQTAEIAETTKLSSAF